VVRTTCKTLLEMYTEMKIRFTSVKVGPFRLSTVHRNDNDTHELFPISTTVLTVSKDSVTTL